MGVTWETYISCAANVGTFEVLIVQFVHGDLQVASGLELHESSIVLVVIEIWREVESSPFAIAVASDLRVNDVKSGATGEIFQILKFQVSPESR